MENNKNKKPVKFQGDMLDFCDFIQVFVFTPNHHLNLHEFLFAPLAIVALEVDMRSTLKGKILKGKNFLLEEQILFLKRLLKWESKYNRVASPVSIPIHHNTV